MTPMSDITGMMTSPYSSLFVPVEPDSADEKVINVLNSIHEVEFAMLMDEESVHEAFEIEGDIGNINPLEFDNPALRASKERTHPVFVLCNGQFDPAPHQAMVMINEYDELVGFFADVSSKKDFPESEGYNWITDELVVTDKIANCKKTRMMSMPQYLTVIGEKQGVADAISFLPSINTDQYLRQRFCYRTPLSSMTAIVSYNVLE